MKSPTHGFGVFADKKIRKGELIEECYFLIGRGGDKSLENFYFDAINSKYKRYATFFGYGSIYNHSEDPNADYFINLTRRVSRFVAQRTIEKGEEILISYGDHWFKERGYKPVEAKKPEAFKGKTNSQKAKAKSKSKTKAKTKNKTKVKTKKVRKTKSKK